MGTAHSEYSSFADLAKSHAEARDFHREVKLVEGARAAIIAPHGGRIEPHTDAIAKALAGEEFSLYSFSSRLSTANANLHITSHRFDDPDCVALIGKHEFVVAVHGWAGRGEAILIGGLDAGLASEFAAAARALGIETYTDGQGLAGTHPQNICNRGKLGRGVQIELTMELRKSPALPALLAALRKILLQRKNAA
jgi:phage replication-related protein YjqB (UPF0714/DUF867 family)